MFLITSYSTSDTHVYFICNEESVDLFNYYNHKENCQCPLSLSLFFFLLSVSMCARSEAVAATECESMMMMIEQ
jgi:hypothetical protein